MPSEPPAFLENYSTIGFHGTSREAAIAIQVSNFSLSRGNDHWLGEGAYFFETGISDGKEDAKRWAIVSAWDNDKKCLKYPIYSVLQTSLEFKRLWDLSSREGLKLFEHARSSLLKRGVRPKEATSGRKFDNAVIEFSAAMMNFDGLRAWFFIKLDTMSRILQVQSGIQNVTVICVRSPQDCISLDRLSRVDEGFVKR